MKAIGAIQSIKEGFDFTYILSILMGLIPALICITFHELSHGYVAWRLGDDTAKNQGRLTLNPLKHLDVMGLLMMLVFHVGWAKPVPINMYKFKNPKRGMAISALAGPASNFLLAAVFMLLYGAAYIPLSFEPWGSYPLQMLELTAYLSIGLGIFNLIPIPPLDGSKVLFSVMSNENYYKLMRYERYGGILMLALVASGVLGKPLSMAIDFIYSKMLFIAQFGCDTVFKMFYAG